MSECECFPVENPWTYYGIVEPGGALEPNHDCPEHFPAKEKGPTPLWEAVYRLTTHRPTVVRQRNADALWMAACDAGTVNCFYEIHDTHAEALAAALDHAKTHQHCGRGPCCLDHGHEGKCKL